MFTGIIYALGALFGWGFGDFLIQRSSLRVGPIRVMLYIGIAGAIGLLPFVTTHLPTLLNQPGQLLILTAAGAFTFIAALCQFEAFKEGSKLSVVEPILGLELPLTIILAVTLHNESFGWVEGLLSLVIFVGILLAITRHHLQLHYHKRLFEKGAVLALVAAMCQALLNLTVGIGSQEVSPLVAVWFMHSFVALACGFYLILNPHVHYSVTRPFKNHGWLLLIMMVIDNLAWLSYAYATTRIPIALAITISESYIALAVLLGLVIGKEKLKRHQLMGAACAIVAVIILASLHPG